MRNLPYILLRCAVNAEKIKFMNEFGKLEPAHLANIRDDFSKTQKKVLFEEILFLKYIKNENFSLPLFIKDTDLQVFSNGEYNAEDFFHADNAAMVTVPLDNSENNAPPQFFHLWLFKGLNKSIPDDNHLLDETGIIQKDIKIYISRSDDKNEKIFGKSWQLAYKLAERVLTTDSPKNNLAEQWIITGQCSDNSIEKIELGNKLILDIGKKKTWLMPLQNRPGIPQEFSTLNIKFASTLDDAWSHISNKTIKQGDINFWPETIDELHILVGGSIKAPFMPLLFTKTEKVVLWTSEDQKNSKDKADLLKEIISIKFPDIQVETPAELSSYDIQKTEIALLNYFKSIPNKKILFNITSGTKLMGLGAQTVARLYPNVELVYRDFVNKELGEFIHLLYTEFPPYSGTLKINNEIKEQYNWDFLNKNYREEPFDNPNDFIQKLVIYSK